jgi:hypothetical protein
MANDLDRIPASTYRYITRSRSRLADQVFQAYPILSYIKEQAEERDEFYDWAMKVRKEAGLPVPDPPEKQFVGGQQISENFQYQPKTFSVNITVQKEDLIIHGFDKSRKMC